MRTRLVAPIELRRIPSYLHRVAYVGGKEGKVLDGKDGRLQKVLIMMDDVGWLKRGQVLYLV